MPLPTETQRPSLLLVPHAGDEAVLYGPLLLAEAAHSARFDALLVWSERPGQATPPVGAWAASVRAWGIAATHRLDLPGGLPRTIDPIALCARFCDLFARYERVFVPDLSPGSPLGGVVATALAGLARGRGELLVRTSNGVPDALHALDRIGMATLLDRLNRHYPGGGLSAFGPETMAAVAPFRRLPAAAVARYIVAFDQRFADAAAWHRLVIGSDPDPWGLATSAYEAERHALELGAVAGLDWASLAEVGPCRGVFTRALASHFPGRQILAIEADPGFAAGLRGLALPGVTVVEGNAGTLDRTVDLLLCSSCLYYVEPWPDRLIAAVRSFVVTSHFRAFEEARVVPAMIAAGWRCRAVRELGPRLELVAGELLVRREGTLLHIWERA